MTGWPEHGHRSAGHRQPRPASHWAKGDKAVLHAGPVRGDCPECIAEGCICPPDFCLGAEDQDGPGTVECKACLALDPELPCIAEREEES